MDVVVIVDARAQKPEPNGISKRKTKANWNRTIPRIAYKRLAKQATLELASWRTATTTRTNLENERKTNGEKSSPKSGKRIFQEINRNTLSKLNVVQHQYRGYVHSLLDPRSLRIYFHAKLFFRHFIYAVPYVFGFFALSVFVSCMWWCASVLHFLVLLARIMCRWWCDCCTWASCLAKCMCYHLPPANPIDFCIFVRIFRVFILIFSSHFVCVSLCIFIESALVQKESRKMWISPMQWM